MRSTPSLAQCCQHEFSRSAQSRGERYWRSGRVRVDEASAERARGVVRGSREWPYAVCLSALDEGGELDERFLDASCSCPHFEEGLFCKHLWAFLLELDATEAGPRPRHRRIELLYGLVGEEEAFSAIEATPAARDLSRLDLAGAALPSSRFPIHYVVSPDRSRPGLPLEVRLFERQSPDPQARLKDLTLRPDDIPAYGPDESEALHALAACAAETSGYPGSGWVPPPPPFRSCTVAPGLQPLVLPLLAGTGHLFSLGAGSFPCAEHLSPLRWEAGAPFSVALRIVRGKPPQALALVAELRGPDAPEMDGLRLLSGGLAVAGERIVRIESRLASVVGEFIERGPLELEAEKLPELLDRIGALGLPMPELPDGMVWSEERGTPRGRLEVRSPHDYTPQTLLYADVHFDYGPRRFRPLEPFAGFADPEAQRLVRRDTERERKLLSELADTGLRELPAYREGEGDVQLGRQKLGEHAAALLARGWEVEAEGARLRHASHTRVSVRSGVDWFDLEGEVSFDDQRIALPELLAAAGRGESTVTLDDGSVGLLPQDWLARMAPLARLGAAEGDALRFLPSQVLLIDALLAAQPEVDADALFRTTCQRIQKAGRPKAARAPRGLKGSMRPYQRVGLGWLSHMGELGLGACLADDMGLGKTLQALALLQARRSRRSDASDAAPSLAVVPASLVQNWLEEAARFTPQLSALPYTGTGRAGLRDRFDETDLVVTTYGTLRRDVDKLADQRFDCVILDEAQAIKNPRAQVSKAARLLRAEQRVALSGTPVENHLGELWALFDFLNPGMLGPKTRAATLADASSETVSALSKALAPFILRRTKDQVLKELPQKTEQTLHCELEGRPRRLYRELRDHYRAALLARVGSEGMARSKIHVLEALLRLRQAACHPGLVDPDRRGERSAKFELLRERLDQALEEGHKALVFSQFTSLLALLRPQLDEAGIDYEYLDGRTRKRAERVRRFQEDPDCRLFLVSLKAGGQGLNLTAADYVFLLDPWWNPAVETQAIDRAHRIGQERPVFAYRLVASDTVEEKILALQASKRDLAEAIVAGNFRGVRDLTREDLELLLG